MLDKDNQTNTDAATGIKTETPVVTANKVEANDVNPKNEGNVRAAPKPKVKNSAAVPPAAGKPVIDNSAPPANQKAKHAEDVVFSNVYIKATFNNTLLCCTKRNGDVVAWSSSGAAGFKGSRKSTPHAAQMAAEQLAQKSVEKGVRQVDVFISGPGLGRDAALRGLQTAGLIVTTITDTTRIPHNGCTPPNARSV